MTKLLEQAISAISTLPEAQQDEWAQDILQRIGKVQEAKISDL